MQFSSYSYFFFFTISANVDDWFKVDRESRRKGQKGHCIETQHSVGLINYIQLLTWGSGWCVSPGRRRAAPHWSLAALTTWEKEEEQMKSQVFFYLITELPVAMKDFSFSSGYTHFLGAFRKRFELKNKRLWVFFFYLWPTSFTSHE